MKKIVYVLIAVSALLLILSFMDTGDRFLNVSSQNSGDTKVKIGLLLPMSGDAASLGESAKKSAQLALEEENSTKFEYSLIFEDTGLNPEKSTTAAQKLIADPNLLALINFGSSTSLAVSPIAEQKQISHFAIASDPTASEGNFNFIHWTPPSKEGELMAAEISRRGYKKIAIVEANHPGTVAVGETLVRELEKAGIDIVAREKSSTEDKDIKSLAVKVYATQPDIVVLELFPPNLEMFTEQLRKLGYSKPVTSVEMFDWSNNKSLFEGMWYISDASSPEFLQKFESKYGSAPEAGSAYTYDLIKMLINLQETAAVRLSSKQLPELLSQNHKWQSPIFGEVQIDNSGYFMTPASVKVIQNSTSVSVD